MPMPVAQLTQQSQSKVSTRFVVPGGALTELGDVTITVPETIAKDVTDTQAKETTVKMKFRMAQPRKEKGTEK